MTVPEPLWTSAPRDPTLAAGEVHVWRIGLDDAGWSTRELARALSEDEVRRADRFRFERDRQRFVVARAGLRRILAVYSGLRPAALRFTYGAQGKPALDSSCGQADLRFNLSHSRGLALCGVTRERAIGVDVEKIRSRVPIERIAARFFSRRENEALLALPCDRRRETFFRYWTRKEAYLKAIGEGLFRGSPAFDVSVEPDEAARWRFRDLTPLDGYVGAVLVEGSGWSVEGRYLLAPT